MKSRLDRGRKLPPPDGILINGRSNGATLNVEQGVLVFDLCVFPTYLSFNIFFIKKRFFACMYVDVIGKTYRLRISNVGLQDSLNFRIQNHRMKLVEVEGTHTLQTMFSSLDVHVGQSYSVLITADQSPRDYYVVVSSRFTDKIITSTGVLRYSGSSTPASGPIPGGPTIQVDWSLNQARAIRY